jgi:hypothetical protein
MGLGSVPVGSMGISVSMLIGTGMPPLTLSSMMDPLGRGVVASLVPLGVRAPVPGGAWNGKGVVLSGVAPLASFFPVWSTLGVAAASAAADFWVN